MEKANEFAEKPQWAKYLVQNAARIVCYLECMPMLLIVNIILKSRMNREVHVRFCEELGVKFPLLTRLFAVLYVTLYANVKCVACQNQLQKL